MFRKMRRFKQQTSDEECIELLKKAPRGVLALMGDHGYPYALPLNFVYDDGKLYFHSAMEGHKIDAIRQCEKASFCVLSEGEQEPGSWWYHFTSVIAWGKIRIVEDRELAMDKLRLLGRKYFPSLEEVEEDMAKNAARAACIELCIEHMTGKRIKEQ